MKKLIITALCLLSIFTIYSFHAQAVQCGSKDGSKIIKPEDVKGCDGVYDDHPRDIFDHLLFINKIALFICGCLFIFGAYKLSTKKEMTGKEKIMASLFVYSPLFSILFFIIIKLIQNFM